MAKSVGAVVVKILVVVVAIAIVLHFIADVGVVLVVITLGRFKVAIVTIPATHVATNSTNHILSL